MAINPNRKDAMSTTTKSRSKTTKPAPSILDEISTFVRRFVAFPEDHYADVLALWILHTHCFDGSYATPYIYVNSAEPQSGKSRVLEVTQLLVRNPLQGANVTESTMFRIMADTQPTLFIDEVDTIFDGSKNEGLRGVLNSGYKTGNFVWRTVGAEVVQFPTFCPKIMAGIDNAAMPDTLRDRCIDFKLKRKKAGQEVERFMPRKVEPEAAALRQRIQDWAVENMDAILDAPEPKIIDGISDRKMEIAEPLLMLAKVARRDRESRKALAAMLVGEPPKASIGIRTLQEARDLMAEAKTDRIASSVLASKMGVTPKRLGTILAAYDVTPRTLRLTGGDRAKGYTMEDLQDAFDRYL